MDHITIIGRLFRDDLGCGAGYPLIYLARRDGDGSLGRKNVRLSLLLFLSLFLRLSLFVPSSSPPLYNDLRWRTDRLGGLGRGWYRHPLVSLLILSDHLPSTIVLATLFCEEPARQLSTDQSLSLSLFFSFSLPSTYPGDTNFCSLLL